MTALPDLISTETQLDELLSEPSAAVIETFRKISGDILLLGVAGKMGLTLALMAKRASDIAGTPRRIIGISRFSSAGAVKWLNERGIETISGDLLEGSFLSSLPDAPNIIYLTGMKFGSTGQEAQTWAVNTWLPAQIAQRFRSSRIVALSTGNIYGLVPVKSSGSVETDVPNPVGEYAMSCLGRERMFEHFSRTYGTQTALIRLNYACELRYGVLTDIAHKVWAGEPVYISMGWFNTIWQADANAVTLAALADVQSPPAAINITGADKLRIRDVAEEFGRLMNKPVNLIGTEQSTALLNDASMALNRYGTERVDIPRLMKWITLWVQQGSPTLNKPTHFESRDGKF
ncbi:MAG: nucleoside-diphosphate-sugar epimerase [Verrucomicrobia bacterium]|jgi:nucleoside-diphosphate-sugar epimerase|nr:nucleoside-diphosphate-sugar epimerase [Verrucomicrobiota bacterium]